MIKLVIAFLICLKFVCAAEFEDENWNLTRRCAHAVNELVDCKNGNKKRRHDDRERFIHAKCGKGQRPACGKYGNRKEPKIVTPEKIRLDISVVKEGNVHIVPMEERFRFPLMIAYERSFYATGIPLTENDASKLSGPMNNQMIIMTPCGFGVLTYAVFESYVTMYAFALPNARGFGMSYEVLSAICKHPNFCNRPIRIRAKKTSKSVPFLLNLGFRPLQPIDTAPDDVAIAFEYLPPNIRCCREQMIFTYGRRTTLEAIDRTSITSK